MTVLSVNISSKSEYGESNGQGLHYLSQCSLIACGCTAILISNYAFSEAFSFWPQKSLSLHIHIIHTSSKAPTHPPLLFVYRFWKEIR